MKGAKERGPEALQEKFFFIRNQILHFGHISLKIMLSSFARVAWATPNHTRFTRYAMPRSAACADMAHMHKAPKKEETKILTRPD